MKPRLSRPLLTAIVSGALVAGGAVYTSPASAADPVPGASESASATPTETTTESPSATPSDSTSPSPSGSVSATPSNTASPSPSVSTSPTPPADKTAPTGTFRISAGGLWLGQTLAFSQNTSDYADNVTPDNQITRKISWGDGTTTVLKPSFSTVNKRYARTGKFNVTVTLTDKAGNYRVVGPRSVSVTNAAKGTYSLSTKKAYQGARFYVHVKKLPAGATGYVIDWADGTTSSHKKSTTKVRGFINYKYVDGEPGGRISGVRTIRVSPVNARGAAVYQYAGKINVLKDNWRPKFTITKPSNPTKASSWKTVRGTASDKGAGLYNNAVYVAAYRFTTTGKEYCLTAKRKWKRIYTDAQFDACFKISNLAQVKVKNGKWSLKLPSTSKGYILVSGIAIDYADRYTTRLREAKLSR